MEKEADSEAETEAEAKAKAMAKISPNMFISQTGNWHNFFSHFSVSSRDRSRKDADSTSPCVWSGRKSIV